MSIRTPNYTLTESHSFGTWNDMKTLDAGTFVRPISYPYVPKHVLEDKRWSTFNKETDVFCYYRGGIIPIPKRIIKEAGTDSAYRG